MNGIGLDTSSTTPSSQPSNWVDSGLESAVGSDIYVVADIRHHNLVEKDSTMWLRAEESLAAILIAALGADANANGRV